MGEGRSPAAAVVVSGKSEPEPHLVRSPERSCSLFPAGVWGRGGGGQAGRGRPGSPPTAGPSACGGHGAGQAGGVVASEFLSCLSQNKTEKGMTGMFIWSKHFTATRVKANGKIWLTLPAPNPSNKPEIFVPFCMCWWRSSGRKAKFAEGKIKPNLSAFALASDYKKRIIDLGFLKKKKRKISVLLLPFPSWRNGLYCSG